MAVLSIPLVAGLTAQAEWTRLERIHARYDHAAAYDAGRDRLVVHGGLTRLGLDGGTWEWDGTAWARVASAAGPGPRLAAGMVYDGARRRTVLFGGTDFARRNDTWAWDGRSWSRIATASAPPERQHHAIAYDAARREIVVFGGEIGPPTAPSLGNDTWVFDGTRWTRREPAQRPSPRLHAAMAYDAARARVVLFGGTTRERPPNGSQADTWEWDGSTWRRAAPATSPPRRHLHAMTYDASRQRIVLSGGIDDFLSARNDVWEWDGRTWVVVSSGRAELQRHGHSLTYDSRRQRSLLFAGATPTEQYRQDVWSGSGASWTKLHDVVLPPVGVGGPMAHDAGRERTVLYGTRFSNTPEETWELDGRLWERRQQGSAGYHESALAYGRGKLWRYGGARFERCLQTLLTWSGSQWTAVDFLGPCRARHAMTFDEARGRLVLYGGFTYRPIAVYGETWEHDGTGWRIRTSASNPLPRQNTSIAYDATRRVTVLFGGFVAANGRTYLDNETWEWDGVDWRRRQPRSAPAPRQGHQLVYDPYRQRVVLFGGRDPSARRLDETWEWDGVDWLQRAGPGPDPESTFGTAYDSGRRRLVLYDTRRRELWHYATTAPGEFEAFGAGCRGTAGVPVLSADGYPWAGDRFVTRLANVPANGRAVLGVGFSNTRWGPLQLPLRLDFLGMPGCTAYTSIDLTFAVDAAGRATIPIPKTPLSIGTRFFTQGVVLDPAANPFGATVSNAASARVGAR